MNRIDKVMRESQDIIEAGKMASEDDILLVALGGSQVDGTKLLNLLKSVTPARPAAYKKNALFNIGDVLQKAATVFGSGSPAYKELETLFRKERWV